MMFEEMKEALVAAAERAGLTQYEIYYQCDESISAETLKDEISTFSSGSVSGICFRCIADGRVGYASGELMSVDAMEELVANAVSNAACVDADDTPPFFAGSPAYASVADGDVTLTDAARIRENALAIQRATYAASERVGDGTQSGAVSEVREIRLYNSTGLSLCNRVGMKGGYAVAIVRDGEEAQESFEFEEGEDTARLCTASVRAVKDATDKLGAGEVTSGKYDVLFDGRIFRDFLAVFSDVFSAKNAQLGLSLLAGKEGEKIAADHVTVIDDPMREGNSMKAPFDGEGVATARRAVIEKGILTTLLYDLTTAAKAGKESTGNGRRAGYAAPVAISPYNFYIEGGEGTREELLTALGNGILITEAKGFHAGADSVTGDFSIESAGFVVRDGKRAEPVKSFTVAGNFFELLRQIDRIGETVHWGMPSTTAYGSPDILVRDMSVAGK